MDDWKERLAALRGDIPANDNDNDDMPAEVPSADASQKQSGRLKIVVDKKGRKGKVATIIEGFTIEDEAVEELASELKRKIGTGGSARGGEILLQGDWHARVAEILSSKGFKC